MHQSSVSYRFFKRLGQLQLQRPKLVLIPFILLHVGMVGIIGHKGIKVDNRPENFASADDQGPKLLETLRKEFGRDDFLAVYIEGPVFTTDYLNQLVKLHKAIETMPFTVVAQDPTDAQWEDDWGGETSGSVIEEITSLHNARRVTAANNSIEVSELMAQVPPQDKIEAFKNFVLTNQSYVNRVINSAGTASLIIIKTDQLPDRESIRYYLELKNFIESFSSHNFKPNLTGALALNAHLDIATQENIGRLSGIVTLLTIGVLWFLFRHWVGVVAPLLVAMLSAIWGFTLMAVEGYTINYISAIIPNFLIAIGFADSIHLKTTYRKMLDAGKSHDDAIVEALGITGLPIIFTSLTTFVGLLSFKTASLGVIQELGTIGAFGVTGACFNTLILVPLMLKLDRKQKLGQMRADKKENSIDKFVLLCNRISGGPEAPFGGPSSPQASRRRTYLTLGLGVVIVGMSVSSALSLKISHDPLKFIESDHPIRINFEKLDREIGGTAQINLLIDAKSPKGLRDLNFIKALEKFEKSLMDYKHPELQEKIVTSISSILEIIRETNKSLHNDDPNYYRIPDSDRALSDILFIFENTAPEDLRRMTTADLSRSLMTVQLHWLPCTSYKPLTKYLNNYIENNLKDFATIQPTGLVYSMLSTLGTLAVDLFNSFGIALLVITILMIMLLQDIKLGLVSLIPNLVPIIMVLGIMYLVNIPLNLTNILLGSIAIGLCVDDTIHLLHHYRVCRLSGFDVEKSIEEALRVSGKSIVSTSLVIIMGLSSYLTANLTNLTQFGLLIILCIFCALFTDLTLGPAVLRLLHGKKA